MIYLHHPLPCTNPPSLFSLSYLNKGSQISAPKSGTGFSVRSQATSKPDARISDMLWIQGGWETLWMQKRGGGGNSWWGKVRENWKGEHDTKKKWIKKLNEIKKIPQRRYPWVGGTDGGLMWIYCQHDFKKLLTNKKINKADNTDIASGFRRRERNAKENRRTQALQTVWIPSSAYINGTL